LNQLNYHHQKSSQIYTIFTFAVINNVGAGKVFSLFSKLTFF
jgi:hypothetical protein